MNRLRALVALSTLKEKKKMEDYLTERTGRKFDLEPLHYNGKLTLLTLDADLTHISSTNITCAHGFPGYHFRNVDSFMEWHRKIVETGYPDVWNRREDLKEKR